jgi:ferrous iron transport protein A
MRFFSGYPMLETLRMGVGRKRCRSQGGDEPHKGGFGKGLGNGFGRGSGMGHGGGRRHQHDTELPLLSLADLSPGDMAVVTGLNGGETYRKKLLSLGLVPGSMVELLRNSGRGAGILIRLGRSTLMLNAGLADRIAVNPVRN